MVKKIRSKKGGSAIIVIFTAIFVAFLGILPSVLDNSYSHIANKKIKSYLNSASNSASMAMTNFNNSGLISYDLKGGADAMEKYFEQLFGEDFILTTTPIVGSNYYSATYKNKSNTIAFQYIGYDKGTNELAPGISLISPAIKTNSKGQALETDKLVNATTIKKPTAIIILRYDFKSYIKRGTESMIRIAASQVNIK